MQGEVRSHNSSSPFTVVMQAQQFSTPRKNLQVAVVGGGVCGLVCAIALIKRGVSVQIYEAAVGLRGFGPLMCIDSLQAVFGAVGAGIGIGEYQSVKVST